MPGPAKKITAAEKLITMEQMLQSRVMNGVPPSERVQMAMNSFQTAPTPEEIERVASDLMQTSAADALEFKVYASMWAAPENARREAAQRQFDSGSTPIPVVDQALKSFRSPPTPEQIEAVANHLRAAHGEDVGQQFETYAANLVAQRAGRQQPAPVRQGTTVVEQPQAQSQAQVQQAGMAEPGLLSKAKTFMGEIGQGMAHVLTAGAVPAPAGAVQGNNVLREKLGLEPVYKDARRDLNKERDLLNEAKKVQ